MSQTPPVEIVGSGAAPHPRHPRPPLAPSCELRPDILVCTACGLRDLAEPHDCPRAARVLPDCPHVLAAGFVGQCAGCALAPLVAVTPQLKVHLEDVVRAMGLWAADEDGIHPAAWEAYSTACIALGRPAPNPAGAEPPALQP